jgi:Tol biopolymer transport system component/DNA-binding winged helix-turn-helix (wHTH) protein
MSAENGLESAAARIDLSREADFQLGALQVRPSVREVAGEGWSETLEPRVMQVLVALARGAGAVVTKEQLAESCWEGRIVAEDSLHRCIARLRRLAEARGGFSILTVSRAGYRLVRAPSETAKESAVVASVVPARRLPWLWLAAGGGAFVAMAALAFAFTRPDARPIEWAIVETVPLVSTPLIERHPAISPDGTMVAYSAGPDIFTRHIYLKKISGGDSIRLTNDPYDDTSSAWSPDGKRIAYMAYKAGEPCRIEIISVPAGLPREAGRCRTVQRSQLCWTGSGDGVFFQDSDTPNKPTQIMRLDFATGRRSVVSHPPPGSHGDEEPKLSPDTHSLAYLRLRDGSEDLLIQNLESNAVRVLVRSTSWGLGFAWSEDGQALFTQTSRGGDHATWLNPLDGSAPTRLTSSPIQLGRLASGPGGLLAAEAYEWQYDLAQSSARDRRHSIIVETSNSWNWAPTYAPDGTLAFLSSRTGEMAVWMMRQGSQAHELASFGPRYLYHLRWSPDGSKLVLGMEVDGGKSILRVISASGRQIADIAASDSGLGVPAWSADGQSLIWPARDAHGWKLWRARLDEPGVRIAVSDYGWSAVQLSGETIYASKSDAPGVWRLDGPSRATLIAPEPRPEPGPEVDSHEQEYTRWIIAGQKLVYVDLTDPLHPQFKSVPIAGGPAEVVADGTGYLDGHGFAVNPRDASVTYAKLARDDSDIVLMRLARRK